MSWIQGLSIGSVLPTFRANPNEGFEKKTQERMQRLRGRIITVPTLPEFPQQSPIASQKTSKLEPVILAGKGVLAAGAAAGSAASAVSGVQNLFHSVTSILPTEAVKNAANATFTATKIALNTTSAAAASATSNAADTAGKIKDVVSEGSADIWGWAKFGWNWGSWGFGYLPPSVKLVLAAGGLLVAYKIFRSTRSGCCGGGNVSMHLNIASLGADGKQCKVIQSKRKGPHGEEVHVDVNCTDPSVKQEPTTKTLKEKLRDKAQKINDRAFLIHNDLRDHLKNHGDKLAAPIKEQLESTVKRWNVEEKNDYHGKSVHYLLNVSSKLKKEIDSELTKDAKATLKALRAESQALRDQAFVLHYGFKEHLETQATLLSDATKQQLEVLIKHLDTIEQNHYRDSHLKEIVTEAQNLKKEVDLELNPKAKESLGNLQTVKTE